MPNVSDEQKVAAATEQQAKTQAALQTVQQQAQDLAQQVRRDLEVLMPQRGQVLNDGGERVQAQQRDNAKVPDSVEEMGQTFLDRDLERLDAATQQLDQSNTEALTTEDRQRLDDLASGLRDIWSGSEQLDAVRKQLDKDVAKLEKAVDKPWDQNASDVEVEQRTRQEQRLEALQSAKDVADAAQSLLKDMERTAVSGVERQRVNKEDPSERPDASKAMGASATDVAGGPEGQRFEWLHKLARMFGGADNWQQLISGDKEVHKDMTALEQIAGALAKNTPVELEITAAHNAIKTGDDAGAKARNGFELRMQMWVDKVGDPKAKPQVDISLDLRASARDPSLKPVFQELRQLNDNLKNGRSPEETMQRLADFVAQHQESVADDDARMQRIWQEADGEGEPPKDD